MTTTDSIILAVAEVGFFEEQLPDVVKPIDI